MRLENVALLVVIAASIAPLLESMALMRTGSARVFFAGPMLLGAVGTLIGGIWAMFLSAPVEVVYYLIGSTTLMGGMGFAAGFGSPRRSTLYSTISGLVGFGVMLTSYLVGTFNG